MPLPPIFLPIFAVLAGTSERVDFAREVRPFLAAACFTCHGPDEAIREAELRLDGREGLFGDRGGYAPIVPGDRMASELFLRISDPDDPMPPASSGLTLEPDVIARIGEWIDQGADWNAHWSFEAPTHVAVPEVEDTSWPLGDIDRFVLARLEQEGLEPSVEADRTALIRRLGFALNGLPPTIAEVDAFLTDTEEGAYERAVDRMLESTRYGERMASDWLDLARYADTSGYHEDNPREIWKWRDWVIEAFNANMPFDQFTIEQLAGDLLPEPTLDQLVATGFNRNHPINTEAGEEEDEYRTAYVVDRVNTTASVWMGLTLGCAQCHDHKYDPLSQAEYYQFYAFFNNVDERDSDGFRGNAKPAMFVPDAEQAAELERLDEGIEALKSWLDGKDPLLVAGEKLWREATLSKLGEPVAWEPFDATGMLSQNGSLLTRLADESVLAFGPNPVKDTYELVSMPGKGTITAIRLEVLPSAIHTHEDHPTGTVGRSQLGLFYLSEFEVIVSSLSDSGEGEPVRFDLGVSDLGQERNTADMAVDGEERAGWWLSEPRAGERHEAVFIPREPIVLNDSSVVRIRLRQIDEDVFKSTVGRFRVSVTDDEHIARRIVPVTSSDWHTIGPFAATSAFVAFTTEFEPEAGFAEGVDLEAKFDPIVLEEPEADSDERGPEPSEGDDPGEKPRGGDQPKEPEKLAWSEKPEWRDRARHRLAGATSATYLVRTLRSDAAREAVIHLDGAEGLRVWLDGELVHEASPDEPEPSPEESESAGEPWKKGEATDTAEAPVAARREPPEAPMDFGFYPGRRKPERRPEFRIAVPEGESELVIKYVSGERSGRFRFELVPDGSDVLSYRVVKALRDDALRPHEVANPDAKPPVESEDRFGMYGGEEPWLEPVAARRKRIRDHFRRRVLEAGRARNDELEELTHTKALLEYELPETMVMAELAEPRETHVLLRGVYNQKGKAVTASVPAVLPAMSAELPKDRLGLARWLVSGEHPLTARVTVNRVWRQHFGQGLVETSDDFGTRGSLPSHPELLDWLASEFVASGWDLKALHRRIVTSRTFRQSVKPSDAARSRDDRNLLLSHAPRPRMSAEMIRDNALAVSGLLVEQVGGRSVKPYQPDGLWRAVSQGQRYVADKGESLYRRGLYVYWKRGMPYPSMSTFDAPMRESCTVERVVTNTPLQALVLLNDPVFVEAARALGARMILEGGADASSRLIYGFRLCTSRLPTDAELAVLNRAYERQQAHFAEPNEATDEFLDIGEWKAPEEVDSAELATWSAIGALLLNLDATIHRG